MQSALPLGSAAPPFALPDADGKAFSLSSLLARGPLLLIFHKISCPTCQFAAEYWSRLAETAELNFRTLAQDPPEHAAAFEREFDLRLPNLFDALDDGFPASNAYGIRFVPTLFLIESDGRIAISSEGWDREDFEAACGRIGAASPIRDDDDVPVVRPGCGSMN